MTTTTIATPSPREYYEQPALAPHTPTSSAGVRIPGGVRLHFAGSPENTARLMQASATPENTAIHLWPPIGMQETPAPSACQTRRQRAAPRRPRKRAHLPPISSRGVRPSTSTVLIQPVPHTASCLAERSRLITPSSSVGHTFPKARPVGTRGFQQDRVRIPHRSHRVADNRLSKKSPRVARYKRSPARIMSDSRRPRSLRGHVIEEGRTHAK